MPSPVLSYGSTTRFSWRRGARWGLLVILPVAVFFLFIYWHFDSPLWLRMYELNRIENTLESISAVSKVKVYYQYEEPALMLDIFSADIFLTGGDDRVLCIITPTASELRSGTHLRLGRVGPHLLVQTMPNGTREGIDIGSDGPFANLLPFQIRNAQDLVSRYDEMVKFFDSLPKVNAHQSRDGTIRELHISPLP